MGGGYGGNMPGCVVIGIGNLLQSDDGVGVHAVRYLEGKLPPGAILVEGGVYGMDLLPFLEGRDKAIFIDAIDAGDDPGAVFRFSPREVRKSQEAPSMSLHDFGVYELIAAAQLLDQCPEDIIVIAVQVKSMEVGMELSQEVRGSLAHVLRLVLEEIGG
jgi:hydrogenase maturation protease